MNLLSSYIHKSTKGVIEAVMPSGMYVINQYLMLVRRLKSAFQERRLCLKKHLQVDPSIQYS